MVEGHSVSHPVVPWGDVEDGMSEKTPIQFSEQALDQIEELKAWLGETHATGVVEAAISSAWHVESEHRKGQIGRPWVVRPGPHYFAHEEAAMLWLEEQGAQPVSPGTWASLDEDGIQIAWDIEPLWFEDQAA